MKTKYLWGILGSLCLASVTLIGKIAFLELSVQTLLFLRFVIVVAVIFVILLFGRRLKTLLIKRKHIPLLLAMATGVGMSNICFWYSLTFMDVIPFLAVFWIFPIFCLILDLGANKVKWGYKSALLIISGSLGVFLAIGAVGSIFGAISLLLSALFWSIYYHFTEKLRDYKLLTRIFWIFLIHIPILFICFGLPEPKEIVAMTVRGWVCVCALVLFVSFGGYFFTQKSVDIVNPVATATLNYLEPMVAVILAIVFLGEGMSFIQVIGWGVIFFTLINIRKLKRPVKGEHNGTETPAH